MKTTKTAAYIEWEPLISLGEVLSIVLLLAYTIFGTEGRVADIKRGAEQRIQAAGFNVLRYEGYQRGSWCNHGGKAWYQVQESTNPNIRYRVYVTLWNGELMLTYGPAENVSNLQVKVDDIKANSVVKP